VSQTSSASHGFKADISRIVKYGPSELIGRDAETDLLNDAWLKVRRNEAPRLRILTFVALGGEGKTSLVAKWVADLSHQGWPGCDAVFAWSFYSQGTREHNTASSDLFLAEALSFFGDAAMAGGAACAFDKGRRLAQLVGERRALLILDGLEPLQYAPTSPMASELKDQGVAALLKGLASNSQGLCVVTTRYAIPDLRAFIGKTVQEEKLTRLSTEAGVALLQSLSVKGSLRKTIPSADGRANWNEYEKLVEDVKGHALTLNLLGSYLRDAHAGNIRQRDLIKLEEADAEEHGGHAFRVMDGYVRSFESGGKTTEDQAKGWRALALLQLLGLFDRPATADCLKALWQAPAIGRLTDPLIDISEAQRNLSLKRLEDAKLLTVNRAEGTGELIALDAHPLLREYFARRVRQQWPEAWRAAHRRLYKHLCATTPDKPQPTLEDLQPLYQAMAHGCQAGLQEEAYKKTYDARIIRSNEYYSVRKLGAFGADIGAISWLFEDPWKRPAAALADADKALLLGQTAFYLRALGRLTESLDPMQAGLEMRVKQENWNQAAIGASNLCELELTLGEVSRAVGDAEQSVTYADRSGDTMQRLSKRATLADALHQAGRHAKAESRFREAEQIQAERQPTYPIFPSPPNFNYCELLLAVVERDAWRRTLQLNSELQHSEVSKTCQIVAERARKTLSWDGVAFYSTILSPSLDHLTLGRAALYEAIPEQSADSPPPDLAAPDSHQSRPRPAGPVANHSSARLRLPEPWQAQSELDQAVAGLRRAGQLQELPRGLLTRAWLRALTGARTGTESAQSDLDEAWEIAARGPMRLFLADIHLTRARLFGLRIGGCGFEIEEEPYPWESAEADLAAAENLINECGYHRRDEELADAKQAILGQALK